MRKPEDYKAKNLHDIARGFALLAEIERGKILSCKTQKKIQYHLGVAWSYLDCADILSRTVIEPSKKD